MNIEELSREDVEAHLNKMKVEAEKEKPGRRTYVEVYRENEIKFEYPIDIGEYPDNMDHKYKGKIKELIKANRLRIDQKMDGVNTKQLFLGELDDDRLDALIILSKKNGYIEEKSNKGGAFFILLGELKEEKAKRDV